MNDTNIRQLMERFLNAETTLEEEQTLYEYFQGEDVADDLKPYRECRREWHGQAYASETDAGMGHCAADSHVDGCHLPRWPVLLHQW